MLFREILFTAAEPGGGVAYSAEATALFARMSSQPDATRKGQINTLIVALKDAGAWSKMDALYVLAAHDAQAARLNWVASSHDISAVNSPTFTADRGYAGDGATSYLDTGFNPSTAGGKFTQNDGHLGFWHSSAFLGGNRALGGNRNARINQPSNVIAGVGSSNSSIVNVAVNNNGRGWNCYSRNNSANVDFQHASEVIVNSVQASAAHQSSTLLMLAYNNGAATPASFSTTRLEAMHFGSALNATEMAAVQSCLSSYMAAVGAA